MQGKRLIIFSCPSVCRHVSARLPLVGFPCNLILETLRSPGYKIQIWLKSDKISGTLHKDLSTFIAAGYIKSP